MKYSGTAFLGLLLLAGCSKKSEPAMSGTSADSATVFNTWSGYTNLLNNAGEWHNSFIMPRSDLTLTANCNYLAPFTLKYEKIRAVNNLKNVYSYFPASPKGIVYLCHGTGGSAQNLVNNFEWQEMIRDLVYAGYAIIVTEAEEVTLNQDLNGDGKIHWTLVPVDTMVNIDYANIRALTDTFYARGSAQPSIPRYSVGMSNGGAFSAALSFVYKFAGSVSYCAPTSTVVTSSSITPLQFCMAKYDNDHGNPFEISDDLLSEPGPVHLCHQ